MLAGKTVIEHSVAAFSAVPQIDEIIVAMTPGLTSEVADLLARAGHDKVSRVLEGGDTRSAAAGHPPDYQWLCDRATDLPGGRGHDSVLGHDRGHSRRCDQADAEPGRPAPLPDPPGLPSFCYPPGLRTCSCGPRIRRHRRLRRRAALPAGGANSGSGR